MWDSLWLGCGSALCAGAVWLCAASDRSVAVCLCDYLCRNGHCLRYAVCASRRLAPELWVLGVCTSGRRQLSWVYATMWDSVMLSRVCLAVWLCDGARLCRVGYVPSTVCHCVSLRDSAVSLCVTVTVCQTACTSNHISWAALMCLSF